MTLVVARRCEGRIYMVSDTKLTPEIDGGRDGQRHFIGGLKIVLLHPGVAIAFAHNVESARQAIEGIHLRGVDLFDKNAVINYFFDHHVRSLQQGSNATVEFIAAFELDTRDSELFVIKNGDVLWVDAGYIGNAVAYNRFLHCEHQLAATVTSPLYPIAVAMQALNIVIRDPAPDFQDVDGFTVALRHTTDNGFVFVQHVSVEGQPIAVNSEPRGGAVTFGGAARGANEWTIGSSPGDRFGVLTAFCHTGFFGVIYCPALNFAPRIVRNCTALSLAKESMHEVSQIQALLDGL